MWSTSTECTFVCSSSVDSCATPTSCQPLVIQAKYVPGTYDIQNCEIFNVNSIPFLTANPTPMG